MFFGKLPGCLRVDLLVDQVRLGCNECLSDLRVGMLLYLVHPVAHIIVALLRGAVIAQDDAIGPLVIRLCYCSKSLLARCVPNLKLDIPAIYWHVLNLEIDAYPITLSVRVSVLTDSCYVLVGKCVF